jgi:hypothetical protein
VVLVLVRRNIGLLSRSASPPLQLVALRWRVGAHVLVRLWPPSGVSTAFLRGWSPILR